MAEQRSTPVSAGMAEKFARWVRSQATDWKTADAVVAEKIGCSVSMVRAMRSGKRGPGLSLAFRIERATRRKIRASEWEIPVDDKAAA